MYIYIRQVTYQYDCSYSHQFSITSNQSYATCVEFHPRLPGVLVAGTYNGEIVAWDLSQPDDPVIGSTPTSDDGHQEPITQVVWLYNRRMNDYQLLSVGLDGKLLLWSLENHFETPLCGWYVAKQASTVSHSEGGVSVVVIDTAHTHTHSFRLCSYCCCLLSFVSCI